MNRRGYVAGILSLVSIAGCLDRGPSAEIDVVESPSGSERTWDPVTIPNASDETQIVQVGARFYDDDRPVAEDPPIDLGRELAPSQQHTYEPDVEGGADGVSRVELRIVEREQGIPPN